MVSPVFKIDAVTSILAELTASRRSASVPLPVARLTVTLLLPLFAVKLPLLFQVPKEKARLPVPVEAVSLA